MRVLLVNQNWGNILNELFIQKISPIGEATTAIWRIFAVLYKPKRTLSKMNLTSMQVSMFLLIVFKLGIILNE